MDTNNENMDCPRVTTGGQKVVHRQWTAFDLAYRFKLWAMNSLVATYAITSRRNGKHDLEAALGPSSPRGSCRGNHHGRH